MPRFRNYSSLNHKVIPHTEKYVFSKCSQPYGLCILERPRPQSRRIPGSKPDSTEDPPCLWARCTLNLAWVKRASAGGMQKFGVRGASSGVFFVI
ncbi:hypothetical protein AVEN_14731-1 [Araneus ventricosus]|uniref:Uncharacterized protein n=1 Tax=Araneus ventricosus TaxID=182803 RepID=A0A4Y2SSY4_ARAVE|nr:hypothetical protein AVEN_171933-1 [Araneus ventricosus]GBN91518.1 hypothetical protein AVEN_14731-1 [Araneus ventricosus]